MDRNQVLKMTNEELRIAVARILGAKWYKTYNGQYRELGWPPVNTGYVIVPKEADGTEPVADDGLRAISDYPSTIDEALRLVKCIHREKRRSVTVKYHKNRWRVSSGPIIVKGNSSELPATICRAFILVMTDEITKSYGDCPHWKEGKCNLENSLES